MRAARPELGAMKAMGAMQNLAAAKPGKTQGNQQSGPSSYIPSFDKVERVVHTGHEITQIVDWFRGILGWGGSGN